MFKVCSSLIAFGLPYLYMNGSFVLKTHRQNAPLGTFLPIMQLLKALSCQPSRGGEKKSPLSSHIGFGFSFNYCDVLFLTFGVMLEVSSKQFWKPVQVDLGLTPQRIRHRIGLLGPYLFSSYDEKEQVGVPWGRGWGWGIHSMTLILPLQDTIRELCRAISLLPLFYWLSHPPMTFQSSSFCAC